MKENKPIGLIAAILAVIVLSLFFLFYNFSELERRTLTVKYEIGDNAGFNVEASSLNFGRLVPGSKGTRSISLHNEHSFPVSVSITADPEINDMLIFNRTVHRLAENESILLPMTLSVPADIDYGNYTSFIVVHVRK